MSEGSGEWRREGVLQVAPPVSRRQYTVFNTMEYNHNISNNNKEVDDFFPRFDTHIMHYTSYIYI